MAGGGVCRCQCGAATCVGFLGGHTRDFREALAAEAAGQLHSDLESVLDALPEFSGDDGDSDGHAVSCAPNPCPSPRTLQAGMLKPGSLRHARLAVGKLRAGVLRAGDLRTGQQGGFHSTAGGSLAAGRLAAGRRQVQPARERGSQRGTEADKLRQHQPFHRGGHLPVSVSGAVFAVAAAASEAVAAARAIPTHQPPSAPLRKRPPFKAARTLPAAINDGDKRPPGAPPGAAYSRKAKQRLPPIRAQVCPTRHSRSSLVNWLQKPACVCARALQEQPSILLGRCIDAVGKHGCSVQRCFSAAVPMNAW